MLEFLNNKKVGNKGFTLVELMIVVAIIGILAAIAVPQFMSYRLRAYNAGAKAIVHNLKADQSNLNAELGLYGHTEAAAATLIVGDAAHTPGGVSGLAADTFTIPALRVPATAAAAGARLVGTNAATTRTITIPVALGNNMIADVQDINNLSNDSTFHVFARHYKGDTAYAMDNDVENALCTVTNPAWPNTAGICATTIPPALPAADDINGALSNGAPTTNWTLVP